MTAKGILSVKVDEEEKIRECVATHDIEIRVIDVISDVFSGAMPEEVDNWIKWCKNIIKVASVGGTVNEEMLIGFDPQFSSADINIVVQRDESHENLIMRNTLNVLLLKSRDYGGK